MTALAQSFKERQQRMTNGTLDKFLISIDNSIDWGFERSRLERPLIDNVLAKVIQVDENLLNKDQVVLLSGLNWIEFSWSPDGQLVSVKAVDANNKEIDTSILSPVLISLLEEEAADWLDEDTCRYMDHGSSN